MREFLQFHFQLMQNLCALLNGRQIQWLTDAQMLMQLYLQFMDDPVRLPLIPTTSVTTL